jgi:hypothetical protein
MAVEAARREASGLNKRATLMKHLHTQKRESWTTALSLTEKRAIGSPPEKKHLGYERATHSAPDGRC